MDCKKFTSQCLCATVCVCECVRVWLRECVCEGEGQIMWRMDGLFMSVPPVSLKRSDPLSPSHTLLWRWELLPDFDSVGSTPTWAVSNQSTLGDNLLELVYWRLKTGAFLAYFKTASCFWQQNNVELTLSLTGQPSFIGLQQENKAKLRMWSLMFLGWAMGLCTNLPTNYTCYCHKVMDSVAFNDRLFWNIPSIEWNWENHSSLNN